MWNHQGRRRGARIAKLISGLFEPWEGSITFDGKPRSEIPREVFKGSLSVVDQDVVLFADTIENYIRMWDRSIKDFDMILAAKDADIYDYIMLHQKGFRYRLEEGGRNVSGGQRQRMEVMLENATMGRLINLPPKFFQGKSSGGLSQSMVSLRFLPTVLTDAILGPLMTVGLSIIYIIQIATMVPSLALPALVIFLLQGGSSTFRSARRCG